VLKPTPYNAVGTATVTLLPYSYFNNLVGDWGAFYTQSAVYQEVIRITSLPDGTLQGLKIIGDKNIPAGQISFKLKPDFSGTIQGAQDGYTGAVWTPITASNTGDVNHFTIVYNGIPIAYSRLPALSSDFLNLVGIWTAVYDVGTTERVGISITDGILTAVKIFGDFAVVEGRTTFQLASNFLGRLQTSASPAMYGSWLDCSATVTGKDSFTIKWNKNQNVINFTRAV